jgi:poly-gamma-glutamate synthesis protein (capsule biosynthesis protein)
MAEKAVALYTSPEKAAYLKDAGFDILNIANNHIMDKGAEGFHETLRVLNRNNLPFIGVNNKPERNYKILEKKGIKLGVLGYTEGGYSLPEKKIWINKIDLADIIRDIKLIKPLCEFVIISLHWGTENVFYPSPEQINFAHTLIDHGATVILGHHPHVIQGIEKYKKGLIAYSLGNFQFDPELSCSKTNKSILLCLNFNREELEDYEILPIVINREFLPVVDEKVKNEMKNFIDKISQPIVRKELSERWWFEEIAREYLSGNMKSFIIRIKRYGIKHLFQYIKWLISPFVIKCYMGILRQMLRKYD